MCAYYGPCLSNDRLLCHCDGNFRLIAEMCSVILIMLKSSGTRYQEIYQGLHTLERCFVRKSSWPIIYDCTKPIYIYIYIYTPCHWWLSSLKRREDECLFHVHRRP